MDNCKLVNIATTTKLDPNKITFPNVEIMNIQFRYIDIVDLVIDGVNIAVGNLVIPRQHVGDSYLSSGSSQFRLRMTSITTPETYTIY